jgi:hypothetical protein
MATKVRWQAQPVYHLHLRKTAGSSLSQFLAPCYLRGQRLRLLAFHELAAVSLRELANYRYYACHFGPGLLDLVNRPDAPVVTVLRDPVERLISSVLYLLNRIETGVDLATPAYLDKMAALRRSTLLHQVEVLGTELFQNGLVQELGTSVDVRPFLADGAYTRTHGPPSAPFTDSVIFQRTELTAMATVAHATLARMAVVGITERFADTLAVVAELVGVPAPDAVPTVNLGEGRGKVDVFHYRSTCPPEVIELAESLTVADRELYAHAEMLFAEQLARHRANPQRTYSVMPRVLQAARPLLRAVRATGRRSPPKNAPS